MRKWLAAAEQVDLHESDAVQKSFLPPPEVLLSRKCSGCRCSGEMRKTTETTSRSSRRKIEMWRSMNSPSGSYVLPPCMSAAYGSGSRFRIDDETWTFQ